MLVLIIYVNLFVRFQIISKSSEMNKENTRNYTVI
jgi:hypothetical protein